MIDLIYLSHNRKEFVAESLKALATNTNWSLVDTVFLCDDASIDGAQTVVREWECPAKIVRIFGQWGHPVAIMRDYLQNYRQHSIFAKVDCDTMLPAGWLDVTFNVMEANPALDLLGIEAFNRVLPAGCGADPRGFTNANFIGGIGLMRAAAFHDLPVPYGRYFGFTEWQERNPQVRKGWLDPSLPVFLLDHIPFDPWRSLSRKYVAEFGQRDWPAYTADMASMWSWWWKGQE